MDIDVWAHIVQLSFGPFDHDRTTLHYRSIYPMPVGFYDLFASIFVVRNSTNFLCVPINQGVGEIVQNFAIQAFEHPDEVPLDEV